MWGEQPGKRKKRTLKYAQEKERISAGGGGVEFLFDPGARGWAQCKGGIACLNQENQGSEGLQRLGWKQGQVN